MPRSPSCKVWLLIAMGAVALSGNPATAADVGAYPSRPIHLVVPYSTGNTIDSAARLLAAKLSESLGQPVVVDNRVGASGNVGADYVAKAPADGYTVLFTGFQITALPSVMGARAVDPVKSLTAITRLAEGPLLIVACPAFPANSLQESIALARAAPGKIAYASSGVGATTHLTAEILFQKAGVNLLHVPYAQSGEAIRDLLTCEVQLSFTFPGNIESLLRAHRVKPLAVTTRTRAAAWPDVPTVMEQGFPEFEVTAWYAFFAPVGTPTDIVRVLNRELIHAAEDPSIREKIIGFGNTIVGNTPEEFAGEVKAWVERWPAIVKQAGIRIE